ncbi:hypothetical protein HOLleu_34336 [Holothuria leucospilota]|uniref:UMA domain-containing protein n=1 Tax=Holothuria leucospilota TaxID=206669 RepID=A0A9Q0YL96_HOLLE|nr:hypothetical protein HOLleu_34336 [Holothuria leucospilota]
MLPSGIFANIKSSFFPSREGQSNPQPQNCISDTTSQNLPDHLRHTSEEDDYLVVGQTQAERSEVRPGRVSEIPLMSPPPPSYEEAGAAKMSPGHATHPAAEIPFALNPQLQISWDLKNNQQALGVANLQPLDLDKYFYDFSLEEQVKSREGYGN